MTPAQWLTLPESIDVRIVRYSIRCKGRRTRHVVLATTLPVLSIAWSFSAALAIQLVLQTLLFRRI